MGIFMRLYYLRLSMFSISETILCISVHLKLFLVIAISVQWCKMLVFIN